MNSRTLGIYAWIGLMYWRLIPMYGGLLSHKKVLMIADSNLGVFSVLFLPF